MQAMILAAGLGTRMRPLTDHTPKPLLKVAGRSLLEYQLERLLAAGVSRVVINISYLADQIADFISSRSWPVPVLLSEEESPLETAGGIQCALERGLLEPDEPLLLVNGDIWCDFDLSTLPSLGDKSAHLVLVDNPPHHPSGDFLLTGLSAVHRLTGEPVSSPDQVLTFSGISLIAPALIPASAQQPPPLPLGPLLKQAADEGRVSGQRHDGYWLDVGTPERLATLETYLRSTSLSAN